MVRVSPEQAYVTVSAQMREQVESSHSGQDAASHARAWLITGAPRSGKTSLALDLTAHAIELYGSDKVSHIVTNRLVADDANRALITRLTVLGQRRLATTLSALAFRIIEERQLLAGGSAPKLLNGAEQTASLRSVLDAHIEHARLGELCSTCMLLRSYFLGDSAAHGSEESNHTVATRDMCDADVTRHTVATRDTVNLFESYITPTFLLQLRDMFARMNELGASHTMEDKILQALSSTSTEVMSASALSHAHTQIELSYALRKEYAQLVQEQYSDQLRFDSSRLLREAALTVRNHDGSENLHYPRFIVVDDAQELTLAAMFLLQELYKAGASIIFLGNPDESVLGFRGAFGEFFFNRVCETQVDNEESEQAHLFLAPDFACFQAQRIDLLSSVPSVEDMDYKTRIASRVALNIPATYSTDIPLTQRVHKFPDSINRLSDIFDENAQSAQDSQDSSVHTHIFRSPRDEMSYILKQIMRERMRTPKPSWNSMAIIVHDNATARAFGRRLQDEGIPVRFSSITKPLGEDPVTVGLFAAIELARLSVDSVDLADSAGVAGSAGVVAVAESAGSVDMLNRRVGQLMRQFASSPFAVGNDNKPMNLSHVNALLEAVSTLIHAASTAQVQVDYDFSAVREAWDSVCAHDGRGRSEELHASALGTLIVTDAHGVRAEILSLLEAMDSQYSNDMKCLKRLIRMIDAVREAVESASVYDIIAILWAAWDAADVSDQWQIKALDFSDFSQRLRYNEWLDGAMRLFDYANQKASSVGIDAFIERVRNLDISADSLAHLAPLDEAVTVTTPASTAGAQWEQVWMPSIQAGVWPNLTLRNTMLGADNLAEIIMTGRLHQSPHDRMIEVLHTEKRSFLVSLTRAQSVVHMSAVWNDETSPSDFLYTYAPERFPRVDALDKANFTDVPLVQLATSGSENHDTLVSTTMTDVIRQARVILSEELADNPEGLSERGRDALDTLSYARNKGYRSAVPEQWAFTDAEEAVELPNFSKGETVNLSPSSVEKLWGCPICYRLENRFGGPTASTAASSFGTLIHTIAQWASEEQQCDSKEFYARKLKELGSDEAVIDAITSIMMEQYTRLKTEPNIDNVADAYLKEINNDKLAESILNNIATYFVHAHTEGLAGLASKTEFHPPYMPIEHAEAEKAFCADITLEDIRFAYNAIPDRPHINREEFEELIRMLVGGMPEGFDYDTTVRLKGVIDRVEWHGQDNGRDLMYLVDYKTVAKPHNITQQFSNLQLACYQLGILFDQQEHTTDKQRAQIFDKAPNIAMSVLFDVKHENSPAVTRHEAFGKYQPALFVNGHLGYEVATRSYNTSHWGMMSDTSSILVDPDAMDAWRAEVKERVEKEMEEKAVDRTLISLSLVARIFYAAAVLQSNVVLLDGPRSIHKVQYCNFKHVCSACAGGDISVMEEWLA